MPSLVSRGSLRYGEEALASASGWGVKLDKSDHGPCAKELGFELGVFALVVAAAAVAEQLSDVSGHGETAPQWTKRGLCVPGCICRSRAQVRRAGWCEKWLCVVCVELLYSETKTSALRSH